MFIIHYRLMPFVKCNQTFTYLLNYLCMRVLHVQYVLMNKALSLPLQTIKKVSEMSKYMMSYYFAWEKAED